MIRAHKLWPVYSATAFNGFQVAFQQDVAAAQHLPLHDTVHSAYYRQASVAELLLGFYHYYVHVFDLERSVVSIHRGGGAIVYKVYEQHIYLSLLTCIVSIVFSAHCGCDDIVLFEVYPTVK
jgi:Cid1 family poly A polymerase